jgi:putative (di)nucleoside polyphosphate hydrolase
MSTLDPSQLPYRQGVGLCLFNAQGQVLMAERRDRSGAWQMPQGGVQKGEDLSKAVLREMKEEIGTDNAEIIAQHPEILRYEFPDWLQYRGGIFRGKYRGQEQTWFALRYLGTDADIDLSGAHDLEKPEFISWRWCELSETLAMIVDFKRSVYQNMIAGFMPLVDKIRHGGTQ